MMRRMPWLWRLASLLAVALVGCAPPAQQPAAPSLSQCKRDSLDTLYKGVFTFGTDQPVYPRPLQEKLPIWIAVGGTPTSAVRAGMLGLPMAVAIIGGTTPPFVPLIDYYRESARVSGHDPAAMPVSINAHGYIAEDAQQAFEDGFRYAEPVMRRIAQERRFSPPTRERALIESTLKGANFSGSPEQAIEKILYQYELFHHQRFLLQISVGTMPHDKVMRAIELFGTIVAPAVRAEIARREAPAAAASTEQ